MHALRRGLHCEAVLAELGVSVVVVFLCVLMTARASHITSHANVFIVALVQWLVRVP